MDRQAKRHWRRRSQTSPKLSFHGFLRQPDDPPRLQDPQTPQRHKRVPRAAKLKNRETGLKVENALKIEFVARNFDKTEFAEQIFEF